MLRVSNCEGKARLSTGNIGFGLAPRLNAAGRMQQALMAVELLTTGDEARAGEIAAELVPKGEVDKKALQIYENRWRETIGKSITRNFAVKEFFVGLTDDDLNRLIHSLDGIDVAELDLRGLLKVLVRQNPKHLLKLRHLIV